MILLAVAAVAVGGVYGRLPAVVADRVFREDRQPLLATGDLLRPFAADHPRPVFAAGVQVVCALLFGATALVVGTRWVVVAYLWFVAVTLTLTITDVDRKLIPNRILFPGTGIAAVLLTGGAFADGDAGSLVRAAAGAGVFFGTLFVLSLVARGGFGMGDVKLAVLLGGFLAFEAWSILVVGAVGAFLLGGIVSLLLLAFRIKGRKETIPFGPYLVIGAYVALAAGDRIADWYRG